MLKDIMAKSEITFMVLFKLVIMQCFTIGDNIAMIYMTDTLKFSKEHLGIAVTISFPFQLIAAVLAGYTSIQESPFSAYYYSVCFMFIVKVYMILVLFQFWPLFGGESDSL